MSDVGGFSLMDDGGGLTKNQRSILSARQGEIFRFVVKCAGVFSQFSLTNN
jgi:hypothetical protein